MDVMWLLQTRRTCEGVSRYSYYVSVVVDVVVVVAPDNKKNVDVQDTREEERRIKQASNRKSNLEGMSGLKRTTTSSSSSSYTKLDRFLPSRGSSMHGNLLSEEFHASENTGT